MSETQSVTKAFGVDAGSEVTASYETSRRSFPEHLTIEERLTIAVKRPDGHIDQLVFGPEGILVIREALS